MPCTDWELGTQLTQEDFERIDLAHGSHLTGRRHGSRILGNKILKWKINDDGKYELPEHWKGTCKHDGKMYAPPAEASLMDDNKCSLTQKLPKENNV